MQGETIATPITVNKSGTCIVDGYGIALHVQRSHLVVTDGIGATRRIGRFARAASGLRRLVVLGHSGHITIEAIRWLADVGVAWIHLGHDGRVLGTSSSLGLDDPRLRRAQALAKGTPAGIAVARDLLRVKLGGQQRVAGQLGSGSAAADAIDRLIPRAGRCRKRTRAHVGRGRGCQRVLGGVGTNEDLVGSARLAAGPAALADVWRSGVAT